MALEDKIPVTEARLATSIKLVYEKKNPDGTYSAPVVIGAVSGFERSIDRTIERRRALDSDIPGETVELYPGVTEITLSITRAVLYKNTLVEACGFENVEDLLLQRVPINIIEERYKPDAEGNLVLDKQIRYEDCYFRTNPLSYEVAGALTVIQDVDLVVTRIRVVKK